ncbi:MAG TPA: diguanylate cyclase [Clostridia bacterium]|nr:diguanylate cyclase [Clostridia bacterium]
MFATAFFLLVILLSLVSGCSSERFPNQLKAIEGKIDLREGQTASHVVKLDGEWEFYWNELLTPEDFREAGKKKTDYIDVPGSWNAYITEDRDVSGNGYATYRLLFQAQDGAKLGLKIPRMFTAYQLWVNGERIASAGTVGKNRDDMRPQYLPQVALFSSQQDENEIVIQLSNFNHRSGGILESIVLGSENQILDLRYKRIAYDFLLFGSLMIMGFYHIILFWFRKANLSPLYFGLFCLFLAVRTLLVGERLFIYFFPLFSWEIAHKLQTLTFYLGVTMIVTFFKLIFPTHFDQRTVRVIRGIAAVFVALVLLMPVRIFSVVNPGYQLFAICAIAYLIITFIKIILEKNKEGWLIIAGGLAIVLTSLNDIIFLSIWMNDHNLLFLRSFIRTDNLSAIGQLIFVFTNSMVLAKWFSNSLEHGENMTQELKAINQNLDYLVTKRTEALDESRRKLEKANHTLEQMTRKDPLTGLWNRRHYDEAIEIEWHGCLRYKRPIALMILDIDYFKKYNDCYGHIAGDECLIKIAQAVDALFRRSSDLIIRYGGEEFVILMPAAEKDEATKMAGRVLEKIEELNILHERSPISSRVSVSIGITSMVPEHHHSYKELLLTADKALYQAKSAGRNRYQYLP